MMNYETYEGDYTDALELVLDKGGQLFPARRKYSPNVVVRGSHCTTIWPEFSPARRQVTLLAGELGIDPTHQTSGRVARYFLDSILSLPYKGTYFGKEFLQLARKGDHWHYLYCQKGDLGYCFELDLKSAYFTSLLCGKSLLYDKWKGYIDDGGAIGSLEHCKDFFSDHKWFRLILIGILASHQKIFWTRDKEATGEVPLKQVTISNVSFGAAFNAAHGAIMRVYRLMEKMHKEAGEYCVRAHTDSLLLKEEIPSSLLSRITSIAASAGFQLALKHEGRAVFFDQNTGWIGKHIVGEPKHLITCLEESDYKIYDLMPSPAWEHNWESFRIPQVIPADLVP